MALVAPAAQAAGRGRGEIQPRGAPVAGVGAPLDEVERREAADEGADGVRREVERRGRVAHADAGLGLDEAQQLDLRAGEELAADDRARPAPQPPPDPAPRRRQVGGERLLERWCVRRHARHNSSVAELSRRVRGAAFPCGPPDQALCAGRSASDPGCPSRRGEPADRPRHGVGFGGHGRPCRDPRRRHRAGPPRRAVLRAGRARRPARRGHPAPRPADPGPARPRRGGQARVPRRRRAGRRAGAAPPLPAPTALRRLRRPAAAA